jgi:hypothetical protein
MAARDVVHARLDAETQRVLARLKRLTGENDSAVIRRALRALDAASPAPTGKRIVGMGKFASGHADLGSNREHLHGFGRS